MKKNKQISNLNNRIMMMTGIQYYPLLLLFFISALSPHLSFGMHDPYTMVKLDHATDSIEERVISTNDTINEKYKHLPIIASQRPLTDKKVFSIVHMVDILQGDNITPLFIEELIKKNIFFMLAINRCGEFAIKNIEQVTVDTLEILSDYKNNQPVDQLNKLPLPIKKYVMKKAYNQSKYYYNIIFKGHTNTIERMDINIERNLAATASKDGTFRLWRLSSGKPLHIFDERSDHGYVKFRSDGAQLATSTLRYQNPTQMGITIWDTHSKQALYRLKQKDLITHLNLFPCSKKTCILVVGKKNHLSLYKLQENNGPILVGHITDGIRTRTENILYGKEGDDYTWEISRTSRRLGLCQLALRNTKNPSSLSAITHTSMYAKLTDYEQDIFQAALEQKSDSLQRTKSRSKFRMVLH